MKIIKPYPRANAFMNQNSQVRQRTCITINVTCRVRWKMDNCTRGYIMKNSEYFGILLQCQHTGMLALYAGETIYYSVFQTTSKV